MKKSKIIYLFLFILVILGLSGGSAYFYYLQQLETPIDTETLTAFTITAGTNSNAMLDKLEAENILTSHQKLALQVYLRSNPELGQGIKAGTFALEPNLKVHELLLVFQDPGANPDDILVTIPEGLRIDENAEIISRQLQESEISLFESVEYIEIANNPKVYNFGAEVNQFLTEHLPTDKTLEGYLFPDTYFIAPDATAQDVIGRQLQTLMDKLTEEDMNTIAAGEYSLHDILNIAAMIEREAFAEDEKAQIADVIYKRLEQGVQGVRLLQIDATLLYQAGDWEADAFAQKSIDGPYNTYTRIGLPPGPIANPGYGSINAAIYPEANPYFFYIHDNTGQIHFAETQNEHINNVNRYL